MRLAFPSLALALAVAGAAPSLRAQTNFTPFLFRTLAGSAADDPASNDGAGIAARFYAPSSVAVDRAGNLFVSDEFNETIRKITPDGVVTTLAGAPGVKGSADGTGAAARFNFPEGVAVDANDNVYVADYGNDTVRKITPGGVVTTLAGAPGLAGSLDGAGPAARFSSPTGVAVDTGGNVYVADYLNDTLRKITPAGVVTTLAGSAAQSGSVDGIGAAARFHAPEGVALDGGGNVYVADALNHAIRKVTAGGAVTTLAGAGGSPGSVDALGSAARFNSPTGVAVDPNGYVTVADYGNNLIRRISPYGAVTTIAGIAGPTDAEDGVGGSTDGAGPAAQFFEPAGVAVDGNGDVYVADAGNNTIRMGYAQSVANPGRLSNLSILSPIQGSLTMGFVVGGAGATGPESVLIRATGPALALPPFNVPGVMIDPTVTVIRQADGATVAANTGWGASPGNQAQVTAADSAVGAFALADPRSLDSALVTSLPVSSGGYSVTVAGKSGDTGYALTEVYDATPPGSFTPASPRLVNLSCLTRVAPGSTLDLGVVVGGATVKNVLIRASGPTLAAAPFHVSGTMPDPTLTLRPLSNATITLATDQGWAGDPPLATAAAMVGAFPFVSPASQDAAILATLEPGIPYTIQVQSVSGTGGILLVEIYDVP